MRHNRRTRRTAAVLVMVLGAITVVAAFSPPLRGRLELLLEILPFIVLHTARTTTVFAGFALIMTARGLSHGHRLAWVTSVALLVVAVALNLVRGLDVEEGVLGAVLLAWLLSRQRAFTVVPTRAQLNRAAGVAVIGGLGAVSVAVVLVMTLGRHHRPHWGETVQAAAERLGGDSRLPLIGTAPAAGPILLAVGIGVVVLALWLLTSPRQVPRYSLEQHLRDRERARRIVTAHGGGTLDYFALRDDKQWFFTGGSVVAHAVVRGVCVVSPDPIGPVGEQYQAWADFVEFTSREGWTVTVIGAAADWLPVYEHSGFRCAYLGDEAIVAADAFDLEGHTKKGLRQAVRRVERAGVTTQFVDPARAPAPLREKVLAMAGQSRRGESERGFSMTLSRLFDPADTGLLLVAAVDEREEVMGFIQWVPASDLPGWSLDVMRRGTGSNVPNGVIDFLIVKTIEHISRQGARGLGLNFAVLREVVNSPADGVLGRARHRVLDAVAQHSQLESLGRFNEKYAPAWVPRYVLYGGVEDLPRQGLAIATLEGLTRRDRPPQGG